MTNFSNHVSYINTSTEIVELTNAHGFDGRRKSGFIGSSHYRTIIENRTQFGP
ncbi:unnamed protein product, partial [Schistosoma bovis]